MTNVIIFLDSFNSGKIKDSSNEGRNESDDDSAIN